MTTAKHNRGDYHKRYYARNRAARLAYQRKYDRAHKAEKAKRMRQYKEDLRHGYHLAVLQGLPGVPVISAEEKNRRFKNRAYVLGKDRDYRLAAWVRRWEEKVKSDPELAAWSAQAIKEPQSLEDFIKMLRSIGDKDLAATDAATDAGTAFQQTKNNDNRKQTT
jgi:hypothetical protein